MKILAIDTSEREFSVALLDTAVKDPLVAESEFQSPSQPPEFLNSKRLPPAGSVSVATAGVAVELFPMIERLLKQNQWSMKDIQLMAVAKGPGSFTGLRTGVVAAKTIAYAQNIPVEGVNTLEGMAAQLGWHAASQPRLNPLVDSLGLDRFPVHCVINAQRQQLFVAKYRIQWSQNGTLELTEESTAEVIDRDAWLASLNPQIWVTGTGLKPMLVPLRERGIPIAPQELWRCRASSIGRLAWRDFQLGRRDDLWKLEPIYFRPSYADEKRGSS